MALQAILDKELVDKLPSDVKKEYRAGTKEEGLEGKFVLDVAITEGWALENITGLKNSLSSARTERDGFKRKLGEFGEGVTPQSVADMMTEVETLRKGGSKGSEAAIEAVKKQLGEKHSGELKKVQDVITERDREIDELLITSEATRFITEHGGNVTLLLPHVRSQCTVDRTSGKPKAVVLQADGKSPRLSMKQGNDGNMEIGELVESMKTDKTFAAAFTGSGATGSGKGDSKKGDQRGTPGKSSTPGTDSSSDKGATQFGDSFVEKLKAKREAEWAERQQGRGVKTGA